MTQTDKMLARKEGGVGYLTFNNPERHNAVSLEMWEAARAILDDFAKDHEVRVVVLTGAGRQGLRLRRRHFQIRATSAPARRASRATMPRTERAFTGVHDFPKPTIAMIRGYCIGGGMALAVCCDMRICTPRFHFRHPGGQARPRLRLSRPETAGGCGRSFLRQGDFLHGAAVRRRGGAHDGPGQSRGAGRGAGELCEGLCRDDRRQRAADGQLDQVHRRRGDEGRSPSATWRALPTW